MVEEPASVVALLQEALRREILLFLTLEERLAASCLALAWLGSNKRLFGMGALDLSGRQAPVLALNSVVSLFDVGSSLTQLTLDGSAATEKALALLFHCPNLKLLSLRKCKSVCSLQWIRIAQLTKLLVLDCSGCANMTGGSILAATPYSSRQHPLDRMAAGESASESEFKMPLVSLRSLNIRGINQTGQNALLIHVRGFCPTIESIEVGWWSEFDESEKSGFAQPCCRIELEHLRVIFRKTAQSIRTLALPGTTPFKKLIYDPLSHRTLSSYSPAHLFAPAPIPTGCYAVDSASLDGFFEPSLPTLPLMTLNLCLCRSVSDSVLALLVAKCPYLEELNLRGTTAGNSTIFALENCCRLTSLNIR
jgi:hypothetical protein